MSNFANRLREARLVAGLTQEELGFALDVTKSSVSSWEKDRESPSYRVLAQLPFVLNVSLDHLVNGSSGEATDRSATYELVRVAQDADEILLLKYYRALPATKRKALLKLISAD